MKTLTLKLAKAKAITRIFHIALSAMVVFSLLMYSSCDGPTPLTPTEELKAVLLNKTWTVQSVTVAGVDRTDLFAGMTIKFTDTGFTITHPTPVWPGNGTWTVNDAATLLTRNDNLDVDIEATATTLTLRLNWTTTTLGPGRTSSVAGAHVFVFGS